MDNNKYKSNGSFLKLDKEYYDRIAKIDKTSVTIAATIFALICEKMSLSIQNHFVDHDGRPYVILTTDKLEKDWLHCSRKACYNNIKGLESEHLIRVSRHSYDANRYYIDKKIYEQNRNSDKFYRIDKQNFKYLEINDRNSHVGLENLNQIYIITYLQDLMRLSMSKDKQFYDYSNIENPYYVVLDVSHMHQKLHLSEHLIKNELRNLEKRLLIPRKLNSNEHFIIRKRKKNAKSRIYLNNTEATKKIFPNGYKITKKFNNSII